MHASSSQINLNKYKEKHDKNLNSVPVQYASCLWPIVVVQSQFHEVK
jgi:hypothetical protein